MQLVKIINNKKKSNNCNECGYAIVGNPKFCSECGTHINKNY